MKKYPKIVQIDQRGQLVIPKDVRDELNIEEGTGFWIYVITDEGILLKKIDSKPLEEQHAELNEIQQKAGSIKVSKQNLEKSNERYRQKKKGKFELV